MPKLIRKASVFLVIILMACSCVDITVNAKDEYDYKWSYDESNKTVTISIKENDYITLGSAPWSTNLDIKKVIFEEGITSIKGDKYINVINGNEYINNYMLNAETVVLPDSLHRIGTYAFYKWKFSNINLNNKIKYIDNYAFEGCKNAYFSNLPQSAVEIGEHAFTEATFSNDELTIPDDVTTIGKLAFYGCNLKELTIGKGLKTADYNAFGGNNITDLYYNAMNCMTLGKIGTFEAYSYNNYVSVTDNFSALIGNPLDNVYFGEGVTRIPELMFANTGATKITIPDSVTSIGQYAFEESAFKSITIPDNVSKKENILISSLWFRASKNLINVDLGKNVEVLYKDFYDCENMRIFSIPKTLDYTDKYTFMNCKNVKHMYLGFSEDEVDWRLFREGGQTYIQKCPKTYNCDFVIAGDYRIAVSNGVNILYNYVGEEKDITIPKEINGYHVDKIGDYTFCDRDDIDSIFVPSGIEIGTGAFYGCSANIIYENNSITPTEVTQPRLNDNQEETTSTTDSIVKPDSTKVNFSKKANPIKVTVKAKIIKAKKLKKKAQTVKAITVKNAQGKVTYKLKSVPAKLKKLTKISSKGVITLKKWKKAKKGTYKLKVNITAKGNAYFNSKTITKTVKIKVK